MEAVLFHFQSVTQLCREREVSATFAIMLLRQPFHALQQGYKGRPLCGKAAQEVAHPVFGGVLGAPC